VAPDEVDWIVPSFSANIRIIQGTAKKRTSGWITFRSVKRFKTTATPSAASIPLALYQSDKSAARSRKGDLLSPEAIGGGLHGAQWFRAG